MAMILPESECFDISSYNPDPLSLLDLDKAYENGRSEQRLVFNLELVESWRPRYPIFHEPQEETKESALQQQFSYPPVYLPNEVLAIIFDFYATPDQICARCAMQCSLHDDEARDREPPFIIANVCRAWRHTVLSLPFLWATFDFGNRSRFQLKPSIVALQIERCRSLPILRIRFAPRYENQEILRLLCENNRTASWSFVTFTPSTIMLLQKYKRTATFDNLKTLDLDVGTEPDLRRRLSTDIKVLFKDNTPSLRSLRVLGDSPESNDPLWRSLTDYVGRQYGTQGDNSAHYNMLPRMRNLRILALECSPVHGTNSEITINPPISLQFLHTLTLTSGKSFGRPSACAKNELLRSLTLPSLRTLFIQNCICFQCSRGIIDMVERSGCSLSEVSICGNRTDDRQAFIELLNSQVLGTVTRLSLEYDFEDPDSPPVFPLFTRSDCKDPLPLLEHLELTASWPWKACEQEFFAMIRSRRIDNIQLQSLIVTRPPGSKYSDMPQSYRDSMAQLRSAGMRMDFRFPPKKFMSYSEIRRSLDRCTWCTGA